MRIASRTATALAATAIGATAFTGVAHADTGRTALPSAPATTYSCPTSTNPLAYIGLIATSADRVADAVTGLIPGFSVIDAKVVHPFVWTPLASAFGCTEN